MRGLDERSEGLFSYVSCEARVPASHPLRPIRAIVDEALEVMSPAFEGLYSRIGRPSIPPEKLLRALLLQAFYSVRSERQLMEQLDYNLLFRWFVGLSMDAPVWDVTVFTKNRERLLAGDVAAKFLATVLDQPRVKTLLSDEHFSVDGTLIEAWASVKSFRPKDGSGEPPGPGRKGLSGIPCLAGRVQYQAVIAFANRSPKMTAIWALAAVHSRGGIFQSFSARFKTRNRSFSAASSLGKCPLARTARRSFEFNASMALVV